MIAGTSLLAGGIVTMALALVLRALVGLRFALVTPETGHAAFARTAGTKPADRSVEPLFASQNEASPAEAPHHDQTMLGAAAVAVPAAALALHEPHAVETQPVEAAPDHDAQSHDQQIQEAQAAAVDPPADEQVHEEGAQELPAPGLDDWLDRAFADLHEPVPPMHAEPPALTPVAPEPLHTDHALIDPAMASADPLVEQAPATQLHDDHLDHASAYEPHHNEQTQDAYAEPVVHAEPAIAAPVASQPTSAVIGRYEADGTSYTMYADGSIDAQSDIGLYRFGSMAELKAFIEG